MQRKKRYYPKTNFEAWLFVIAEEKEPDPDREVALMIMSVIGFIMIIVAAVI